MNKKKHCCLGDKLCDFQYVIYTLGFYFMLSDELDQKIINISFLSKILEFYSAISLEMTSLRTEFPQKNLFKGLPAFPHSPLHDIFK